MKNMEAAKMIVSASTSEAKSVMSSLTDAQREMILDAIFELLNEACGVER